MVGFQQNLKWEPKILSSFAMTCSSSFRTFGFSSASSSSFFSFFSSNSTSTTPKNHREVDNTANHNEVRAVQLVLTNMDSLAQSLESSGYSLNLKDWFEGFFQSFKSLKNFSI